MNTHMWWVVALWIVVFCGCVQQSIAAITCNAAACTSADPASVATYGCAVSSVPSAVPCTTTSACLSNSVFNSCTTCPAGMFLAPANNAPITTNARLHLLGTFKWGTSFQTNNNVSNLSATCYPCPVNTYSAANNSGATCTACSLTCTAGNGEKTACNPTQDRVCDTCSVGTYNTGVFLTCQCKFIYLLLLLLFLILLLFS